MVRKTLSLGGTLPKKLLDNRLVPTLVQERLLTWGRCIQAQRLQQRVTTADLCQRMGVSENTLRRLEKGDPGAGAGIYLAALWALSMMDELAPPVPPALLTSPRQRVKRTEQERQARDGTDYF